MNEEEFKGELKRILGRDNSYAINDWKPPLILRHNGVDERKEAYSRINDAIKNDIKGIYVYMKNEGCLYVGAGYLRQRLHSHYIESLPESKSKGRGKRWCEFFGDRENQGEMRVFWKQVDDRKAKVIEQMLIYVLEPKFEKVARQKSLSKSLR